MHRIIIFLLNITISVYCFSQSAKPITVFIHDTEVLKKDSLENLFKETKIVPADLSLQTYLALLYYPELKNTQILFKYKSIKTTMACKPTLASMFKLKNRKYIIAINNTHKKSFGGIFIEDVPFNCQIGLIGHELAHIIDYEHLGFWGILWRAIDILIDKSRMNYEKSIDKITINSGLGWQLLDWSDYVLNRSKASDHYKEFKAKNYLQPQEIKALIDSSLNYKSIIVN